MLENMAFESRLTIWVGEIGGYSSIFPFMGIFICRPIHILAANIPRLVVRTTSRVSHTLGF